MTGMSSRRQEVGVLVDSEGADEAHSGGIVHERGAEELDGRRGGVPTRPCSVAIVARERQSWPTRRVTSTPPAGWSIPGARRCPASFPSRVFLMHPVVRHRQRRFRIIGRVGRPK